ncbi:MAG: hypothetical protein WBV46_10270 [Terriglobales bacterium]
MTTHPEAMAIIAFVSFMAIRVYSTSDSMLARPRDLGSAIVKPDC